MIPEHKRPSLFHALLIFLIITIIFFSGLTNGFIYDDNVLILDQPRADSFLEVFRVFVKPHWPTPDLPYYRPISRLTMVLQKQWHHENAFWFHLFNLLLMGTTSVLVYILLSSPSLKLNPCTAFGFAVLVGVHPISSTLVYPISSGRETMIASFFSIAAIILCLRQSYFLALLTWILALFSKEQAVVVPLIILLADYKRPFYHYAFLTVMLMLYFFIRHLVLPGGNIQVNIFNDPFSPIFSILYTLQTCLIPFGQLIYEPEIKVWFTFERQIGILIFSFILLILIIKLKSKPRQRCLFWAGWFLITLAPTANIVVQEARFAERYSYMPLIGLAGLLATLTTAYLDKNIKVLRKCGFVLMVMLIIVGAVVSMKRAVFYKDDFTFYTQWLKTNPHSLTALNALGILALEKGDLKTALQYYKTMLKLRSP